MMKSVVAKLAKEKGILNPSRLGIAVGITYPTASKIWKGKLDQTRGRTLLKLARVLDCNIDDLFEVS